MPLAQFPYRLRKYGRGGASRPRIFKEIGLRVFASFAVTWLVGGLSRFSQSFPRQVFQERSPRSCPRPPKAPPRLPKTAPSPPQASPKAPQGVPKGSPNTSPKDLKDFYKLLEKPRKNNGFSMIFTSARASSWPHVGLRCFILAHAGSSCSQVGQSCPKLPQVGPK